MPYLFSIPSFPTRTYNLKNYLCFRCVFIIFFLKLPETQNRHQWSPLLNTHPLGSLLCSARLREWSQFFVKKKKKSLYLRVWTHLGDFYRASPTRMALNEGIRETKYLRRKERKLCQETRAVTSGCKAGVDRPAWWLFMSRTTMALITMKRSWESMRLAGNTVDESGCESHGYPSRMKH